MSDAIIKTEDLVFRYTTEEGVAPTVLDGVDLTIREGSFVAILGHNGSGKSTLAKHFNAILLPSPGARCMWTAWTPCRRGRGCWTSAVTVGMVFQNPDNQIVANVVEEDVAFAPENLGVPPEEIRRRVDDALKAVGMYRVPGARPPPAVRRAEAAGGHRRGHRHASPGASCWTSPPPCWTRWAGRRSCLPCGN